MSRQTKIGSPLVSLHRSRRSSGRITLADVAAAAQVAPITVSRYVRDPELVSEALRARVQAAIDALGYVPNKIAQGLASARSSIVVAIVPSIAHSLFAEMLHVLSCRLQQHGYQLLLGNSDYSLDEEEQLCRTFLDWAPAALILTGHHHTPGLESLLNDISVPVIELWDINPTATRDQVGFSHYQASYDMTEHLIQRGYQRIAYIKNNIINDLRGMVRYQGYEAAMLAHGLQPSSIAASGSVALEAGRDAFLHLMAQPQRPQALYFANDNLAAGAILEAMRRGYQIPKDIAMAGFGGFPIADKLLPTLTTLAPDHTRMGEIAADLVLGYVRHQSETKARQVRTIDVGYRLIERETTLGIDSE